MECDRIVLLSKREDCCGKNNIKESLDVKERRRIEKGVVLLLAGVVCGCAHVQYMMRVLVRS